MTKRGSAQGKVPEHHEQGEGVVLRLEDGSTYFFRKEVLDLCRVTDEDSMRLVEGALSGSDEVSGFGFEVEKPSAQVARVEGKLQPSPFWKAISEARNRSEEEGLESTQKADEGDEVSGFGAEDRILIQRSRVPRFSAASSLKDAVQGGGSSGLGGRSTPPTAMCPW
jgi:hypothetical protein